jgi:hypothetical protein
MRPTVGAEKMDSGDTAPYGLEECGGVNALIMELAEGETLANCISRTRISLNEALSFACQIAEALEAAHPISGNWPGSTGPARKSGR